MDSDFIDPICFWGIWRQGGEGGQGGLRDQGGRQDEFFSPPSPHPPLFPYGVGIVVGVGRGAGLSPFFNSIKMS
jgi:hypothetical protein